MEHGAALAPSEVEKLAFVAFLRTRQHLGFDQVAERGLRVDFPQHPNAGDERPAVDVGLQIMGLDAG